MKRYFFSLLVLLSVGRLFAQQSNETYQFGLSSEGLLPPGKKDAYGPGLDSDAAGRPFYWAPKDQPQAPQSSFPDGTLRVKPDAYGLGVGMDQYGRPVERRPVR
jgi:hypothetical protein